MKKIYLKVSLILAMAAFLPLESCIGSFSLTHKVINWNNQVGSKFLNELVFFAFWILPVYEVTAVADLLVINSIEFWSGTNPVEEAMQTIKTENGEYLLYAIEKGYKIVSPDGVETILEFDQDEQTWSLLYDGKNYPFMTFIDSSHVKMIGPDGEFYQIELSASGVMAYENLIKGSISA